MNAFPSFLFFFSLILIVPAGIRCAHAQESGSTQTRVYSTKQGHSLELDLRFPEHPNPALPALLFVHGGGFQAGSRNAPPVAAFLDAMAEAGVLSASISYRLTRKGIGFGCDTPTAEKRQAVADAGADLIDALDHLEADPQLRPWMSRWIAAGSSAGAETALWSGYVNAPDRWSGVISFSGALDASTAPTASLPPLLAVHGQCDRLVPCGVDLHHLCDPESPGAWSLIGGPAWADSLQAHSVPAWSHVVCDGQHGICNSAMVDPLVQAWILEWLRGGMALPQETRPVGLDASPPGRSSCPQPCN